MEKKFKKIKKQSIQNVRWRVVWSQKKTKIGISIVAFFIFLAVFAPLIAPNDPLFVDVVQKLKGPSRQFWLGTDHLGRCIASRLIWGSRYSLTYSGVVLGITICIGVPIGMLSGYIGGKVDMFIMRVIDIFMAMPSFVVTLAIAGTLGPSGKNLVLAMSCVYWSGYARLARALTIQIKEQNFIIALKAGGCTGGQIIRKHILKNIAGSIIALATMEVGSVILSIAGFSFIGIGVQPPMPEWGVMLSDSRNFIQTCPRLMVYPGVVIMLVVMGFNLLGEGMKHGISAE